jgi:hypothetical protein
MTPSLSTPRPIVPDFHGRARTYYVMHETVRSHASGRAFFRREGPSPKLRAFAAEKCETPRGRLWQTQEASFSSRIWNWRLHWGPEASAENPGSPSIRVAFGAITKKSHAPQRHSVEAWTGTTLLHHGSLAAHLDVCRSPGPALDATRTSSPLVCSVVLILVSLTGNAHNPHLVRPLAKPPLQTASNMPCR